MATIQSVETWTGPGKNDAVITPLAAGENGVHLIDHKHYFEHWYFDARLEDGHVVVAFLQASELINRKPGVELHVYKPSGEKLSVTRLYAEKDVRASESGFDVTIGDNHAHAEFDAEGLPVHRLRMAEGDMEFDLAYHNLLPGWKPGGGMTRYGSEEFFAWVVPSPKAAVEGTVRFGSTELRARGIGYQDHNWGVGDMKRIIDFWYWGRIYADDFTLLYAYVMTRKRYGRACSTPLMLARDGRILLSTGEVELERLGSVFNTAANRDYPGKLRLTVPGRVSLKLEVQEVIDAHDFVDDLPVVRGRLVKPVVNRLVGRPGYFRFDSRFELEVQLEGRKHERSGRTLHEMVALR